MKKLLLVLTALAASSAVAQEAQEAPKPAASPHTQRIVDVKHVSPDRLRPLLEIFGIHVKADSTLKIVSLSGPVENVKAAEDAIRRLDVPSTARNVESVFYMLMASQKADSGAKLPAELDSVIKQLKTVSAYQSYRLLETIVLRSREGSRSTTSGSIPAPAGAPQAAIYNLSIGSVEVDPEPKGGHVARLTDLRFSVRFPVQFRDQWQFVENGMNTSVDVREGQKVVIGKANVEGGESALILVVTVKVVD